MRTQRDAQKHSATACARQPDHATAEMTEIVLMRAFDGYQMLAGISSCAAMGWCAGKSFCFLGRRFRACLSLQGTFDRAEGFPRCHALRPLDGGLRSHLTRAALAPSVRPTDRKARASQINPGYAPVQAITPQDLLGVFFANLIKRIARTSANGAADRFAGVIPMCASNARSGAGRVSAS